MSLRRFVNLLIMDYAKQLYSLRRIDGDQLFYPAAAAAASQAQELPIQKSFGTKSNGKKVRKRKEVATSEEMERIRPQLLLSVDPWSCPDNCEYDPFLQCFPLSGRKIFFTDSSPRLFGYDTAARCVFTAPNLHAKKRSPFSISIPSTEAEEKDGCNGTIYIIESYLKPKKSFQFEALVSSISLKSWRCDDLPLPPFVDDPDHKPADNDITSYAVVGDAICISVRNTGTYCFDTVRREWSRAGDWAMPFHGKAEYDPDLKLWVGISANNGYLPAAADLSPVVRGHPPGKACVWSDPYVPEGWHTVTCANIFSMGAGRFCITNSIETVHDDRPLDVGVDDACALFTGLEMINGNGNGGNDGNGNGHGDGNGGNSNGNGGNGGGNDGNGNGTKGKRGLRMIRHKSRRCEIPNTRSINSVL